ncbi:TetR/AcrR family transcriptional regulator [Rhodococcus sp. ABRD24]|uniref:TetR/AcrR family transcriptional regulator n=1 Tax=Rhodococcus sp. ABRD24 TaxID=2507582 RepID=UPI00103ECDAA|nr:TetR/AcrR family transcriptional regulator [Rhodococcus sp. ABRD24]QBJ94998.1 TetR/AcrR family transcriptional regulator [Rhodococcus sp. ABRD24]
MEATTVRDRILAAALHIVGTEGVPALTNRRIAAAAGVSLGSITYHFPTQSDLLRAALTGFVAEETARLLELTESYRDTGLSLHGAAALAERVARDLAFSAERIAPFELYIHAGRDHELQTAASDCFAAYDALTVSILAALGVPGPEALAPTLVATIAGLQLRRLATGDAGQDISVAVLQLVRGAYLATP